MMHLEIILFQEILLVVIEEIPHENLKREGTNLHYRFICEFF